MAQVVFSYNFERIKKQLNVYERSQAKFAAKKTLTRLNKELKGKNGLVAKTYKKGDLSRRFRDPVSFTLNSTYGIQRGTELTVGVKDEKALKGKGNPASKYLFPPIGMGSGRAYDTLFTQYLRNRNLINRSDYPVPAVSHPLVRTNKYGNVTSTTYGNTKRALGKTKKAKGRAGFAGGNSKIQDARVIAFREDKKLGDGKILPKGIYRETRKIGSSKLGLSALFYFNDIPTQKKGGSGGTKLFPEIVKEFSDAQLIKIWLREIKQLAK